MPISRIHSFLVYPAKHEEEQPEIRGTKIPLNGSLYNMLKTVYERAEEECNIEIIFRPNAEGEQQNDCRDDLVAYVRRPAISNGRSVATRLQQVTTHRSGLGLLFLIKGEEDGKQQLVISRFPAEQGVIAEERARQLSVEFVDRVFLKDTKAYKSALYVSDSLERGFWHGRAVDRQISGPRELSDYWIHEFLASELMTTGPAGTKRLAIALRTAIRSAEELGVRQELISASTLMTGQHGQRRSVRQIAQQLRLSENAQSELEAAFPRPDLLDEVFQLDREEFQKHILFRAVEMDNGALLVADNERFGDVFQEHIIDQQDRRVRYSTEGRVIDESLRKRK